MTRTIRRRLIQGVSILLAVGLLYLALRGVDLGRIAQAFREADYRWLVPLVVLIVGANLLRAWRWQLMIDALPQPRGTGRSPGRLLEISLSSLLIGYMVNYAAPRMGEVARTANLATRTDLKFSHVFGTVVSERIFDVFVLGIAFGSVILLLFDRLPQLQEPFFDPAMQRLESLPAGALALGLGATVLLLAGGAFAVWRSAQTEGSRLYQFWRETVEPALVSFKEGLMTLLYSPRRVAILLSTIGMWAGYLFMAYIPFVMVGIAEPYGITILDAWILMALGALGILVPSPGGIGSYHFITIQALVYLYAVPEAEAATYAVLTHAAQLVFYVAAGLLALVYQGTSLSTLLPSDNDDRPGVVDAST